MKFAVVILIALLAGGYIYFQSRNLIRGPILTLLGPTNGTTVLDSTVTIEGRAENIAYITLNDRQIFVDEEGVFQEKLIAGPGYTIMKLEARDKFGRTVEKTLEVFRPRNAEATVREVETDREGISLETNQAN